MVRMHRIVVLALALALLLPASAWAGTVREYQLQYAPVGEGAGSLLIVSALVDPQVQLPVAVTIPVPAGSEVLWAGEVLGGSLSEDPMRDVTVERVGDMDVYTMTIEQVYTAQLEVELDPPTISGNRVTSSLTWTNPGEEVLVTGAVVAEADARNPKFTPETTGEPETNSRGETLHPLTGARVAEGARYVITAEWKRSGASAAGSSAVLPILLGVLVLAVTALVIVLARERTRARRSVETSVD
ncbi:MAG: hypothetical protein JXA36_05230 [Coriobacteriia bacterium]|nr:hypothetical protein [Coriobacteriia bacterium]